MSCAFCLVLLLWISSCFGNISFNASEAKLTALLAMSSYCGNSLVNSSWSCYWCKQIPDFRFVASWNNPSSHIFGLTGIRSSTIYVIWRGTVLTDVVNWAKNFQFTKTNYPGVNGAKVHSGFFSEYSSAKDLSLNAIRKALSLCPGCRIIVSGHSLGGALCQFSALDVASIAGSNSIYLLPLSSPRVGNTEFVNFIQNTIANRWRVVNKADLVPHVPPKIFDFVHIGGEAWLTNNRWVYCNSGESNSCSDQLSPLFNAFDHAEIIGLNALNGIPHGCLSDVNNKRSIES